MAYSTLSNRQMFFLVNWVQLICKVKVIVVSFNWFLLPARKKESAGGGRKVVKKKEEWRKWRSGVIEPLIYSSLLFYSEYGNSPL